MTDSFLSQVAADLWDRYGEGISSLHIVFPNRRASLFFGEALSEIVPCPVWQPASITVDSLMEELSGLGTGERLRLVAELYKVYSGFHPRESFDGFYFWGELLLGDFDMIDKWLADADTLFSNLVDLHALDDRFDYLTEDQRALVTKFWGSFGRERSPEQDDFLTIWRTLAPVYHKFRARLSELGIAYQGMVYRRAAERVRQGTVPAIPRRRYVIAGFNALGACERVLFDYLKQNFETDFYWDYDNHFVDDPSHQAGMFMRDNLRRFPGRALGGGYDNFVRPKTIRSIAAASDVLQCKYAGLSLRELARGRETAIVLADESLLGPLLWSLPEQVDSLNITMGYPLRMHPSYTFVERLIELQLRRRVGRSSLAFYHSDVEGLVRHPYMNTAADLQPFRSHHVYVSAQRLRTTPLAELVFTAPEGWRAISDWLIEVIGVVARTGQGADAQFFDLIATHIRTLANSLEECGIELLPKTYATLLRRSLQSVTVPFEGEPLEGVQVMGILETRALDFENIIFLSAGDDSMPGNLVGAPSFIPYGLKMAYGLPTPEHHEGVWAYHFFRLIQRARHIELVWSSTSDDRSAGEPSRYILQLDYLSPHRVEKSSVSVDVNLPPREGITVEKGPAVMETLDEFIREQDPRRLSPSLLNTYVECPLKFYFRGVARLRPEEELSEEIDGAMLGELLHHAMRTLYSPLIGVHDPGSLIRELIGSTRVEQAVEQALEELYAREEQPADHDPGGSVLLARGTILDYINLCILPLDASRGGFTIERLEEKISAGFDFGGRGGNGGDEDGTTQRVIFHGVADRIDRLDDGTPRVVDYKTGSAKNTLPALMQMNLYALMLGGEVRAELYYVRDMARPDYTPLSVEPDEGFGDELRRLLGEIFDPSIPFTQCADPKPCAWCDFDAICRR